MAPAAGCSGWELRTGRTPGEESPSEEVAVDGAAAGGREGAGDELAGALWSERGTRPSLVAKRRGADFSPVVPEAPWPEAPLDGASVRESVAGEPVVFASATVLDPVVGELVASGTLDEPVPFLADGGRGFADGVGPDDGVVPGSVAGAGGGTGTPPPCAPPSP